MWSGSSRFVRWLNLVVIALVSSFAHAMTCTAQTRALLAHAPISLGHLHFVGSASIAIVDVMARSHFAATRPLCIFICILLIRFALCGRHGPDCIRFQITPRPPTTDLSSFGSLLSQFCCVAPMTDSHRLRRRCYSLGSPSIHFQSWLDLCRGIPLLN